MAATKKTTTKKTITADAEISAPEPEEEPAPKSKKDPLSLSLNPESPQVNFQFMVNVEGLDPGQVGELKVESPNGSVGLHQVQASPAGAAQWILLAHEEGDHQFTASAEGKKDAKETVAVRA